mmetsp:Transcript_8570/g.30581  ORF Transcript_8570/g.30581 Transcript_8570/m.30581 type:complete len:81 (-) Transcript_8570:797-1039(-)
MHWKPCLWTYCSNLPSRNLEKDTKPTSRSDKFDHGTYALAGDGRGGLGPILVLWVFMHMKQDVDCCRDSGENTGASLGWC